MSDKIQKLLFSFFIGYQYFFFGLKKSSPITSLKYNFKKILLSSTIKFPDYFKITLIYYIFLMPNIVK